MNQLDIFEADDSVSYMLPYMNDQYPMDPLVAQFLHSRPDWGTILEIQDWMVENIPQEKREVDHYFSDGTYTRSAKIAGGRFIIGKRHAKGHVTMLLYGDATIITEQGQERVKGPRIWIDEPGIKRAIYTHAESLFVTVHATSATNVEDAEKDLIVNENLQLTWEDK